MNNTGMIWRLAGLAVGIHFGRRFGLVGKTISAYAGMTAAHYIATSRGQTMENGRPAAGPSPETATG